jgi:hypothetical protein
MSTSIDNNFIKLFDDETFVAFQRDGSQLRGTIREKMGAGKTFQFHKYGSGTMSTKGKHGDVPVMNVDHTNVTLTITDYYGGEYINDLDELKTNMDERQLAAGALAKAAGRKVDDTITAAAYASLPAGQQIAAAATGLTRSKVLTLMELMGTNEIPDDGGRVCLIAPEQWTNLLTISEFASQDYVGPDALPWKSGVTAKRWLGIMWMQFTGLTLSSTTRRCLAYHKSAMALGMNSEIRTNFDWVPQKGEYFAQARITVGSVRIEDTGVFQIDCTET